MHRTMLIRKLKKTLKYPGGKDTYSRVFCNGVYVTALALGDRQLMVLAQDAMSSTF